MTIQATSPNSVKPSQAATLNRSEVLMTWLNQRPELSSALGDEAIAWLQELRQQATAQLQPLALPTTRDEEWRFTDLSSLAKLTFQTATPRSEAIAPADLAEFTFPEAVQSRLVFVNGVYAPELSAVDALPAGVAMGNLADPAIAALLPQLSPHFAKLPGATEVFTALNTASFSDAAVLYLPRNQVVETPIHVLFVSVPTAEPTLIQPRCLMVAEPNSVATVIEDHVAVGEGVYFTNTVTEIWVDENAQINHTRLQRDRRDAFHIGKTAVQQARDSRYTCNAVSLGAVLSRHHLEVFQAGEQTQTNLYGLTMVAGHQLADTHSLIQYAHPYGTSDQLQKAIVDDRAHAVFNGKVGVPQAAQLTNAAQLNRNLLLSSKARVDTKPQLEIVADNVKCSHGATVSQLDADEVFYLQSRGIDAAAAQSLLIYAFAYEVLDRLPVASVRDHLAAFVAAHSHQA